MVQGKSQQPLLRYVYRRLTSNNICHDILKLLNKYDISPFLSCKKNLKKSIEYIDLNVVQKSFVKDHLEKGDDRFKKINKYNLKDKDIINLLVKFFIDLIFVEIYY